MFFFKKRNLITPICGEQIKYETRPLKRFRRTHHMQRTYELAQCVADDYVDQSQAAADADCCFCCKVM